jgi:hypothetical protein
MMKVSLFRLIAISLALSPTSAAPANPMGRLYMTNQMDPQHQKSS